MPGRTIAIGDIHGCSRAFRALLEVIQPSSEDSVITLGDYVDRGEDSKGVIEELVRLQSTCQLFPLMGNHEEMMLSVVRDGEPPYRWLQFGGVDTLDSYRFSGDMRVIPDSHLDLFDSLLDFHEIDRFFFVHANYEPNVALSDQAVEYLRWIKLTENVPAPHSNGKKAILGHTHDRGGEIFSLAHLLCLDTYCYGGGWLTAMDVHSGQLWQASREGALRSL
jgi:serine/threonine protein phosphatase 1